MRSRGNVPRRRLQRRPRDNLPIPSNIPKTIKPEHRVRKHHPRRTDPRQRRKVQRQHLNRRQLGFSIVFDDLADGGTNSDGVRRWRWGENLRRGRGDGVAHAFVEDHVEGGELGKTGDVGPGTEIGSDPLHRARRVLGALCLLAQTNGFCGEIHVLQGSANPSN